MKYVIKRTDQGGGYVAPAGSKKSYTRDIMNARRFDTKEEAEADRCEGNERVCPLNVPPLKGGDPVRRARPLGSPHRLIYPERIMTAPRVTAPEITAEVQRRADRTGTALRVYRIFGETGCYCTQPATETMNPRFVEIAVCRPMGALPSAPARESAAYSVEPTECGTLTDILV